jgi:hypothetical protein
MDSSSEHSHLINSEDIDLSEYTKQEIEYHEVKNVSKNSEENFNETTKLKRKHNSDKILTCEFCQRNCTRYTKGRISGQNLCDACYKYESRHGYLNERHHHTDILACEICQKNSTRYIKGKFSGKSLCDSCLLNMKINMVI